MAAIDILTLLSYAALIIDVLLQIRRIEHTKSSRDISPVGVLFRLAASLIILVKLISVGDTPLLIGQLFFVAIFSAYIFLALTHIKHRKK